jgi:hypothetical protein
MGHLGLKDVYLKLGIKIDGLGTKVPRNDTLYAIIKELYTPEEADTVVRIPCGINKARAPKEPGNPPGKCGN